jgi:hypothetical protein
MENVLATIPRCSVLTETQSIEFVVASPCHHSKSSFNAWFMALPVDDPLAAPVADGTRATYVQQLLSPAVVVA